MRDADGGTLRLGIAGLRRGRSLGRVVRALGGCTLAAVCDTNPELLRACARELGAPAVSSFPELCALDLDAVLVASPPPTHVPLTLLALEAGRHVLCEVPAAVSLEEADRLLQAVERSGLIYMIAENVCYFPVIRRMHAMVQEGALGELFLAEGEYVHDCRSLLWNREDGLGGGTAHTPSWRASFPPIQYSTHELGPLLMVLGQRVSSVTCRSASAGQMSSQAALFCTEGNVLIRELVSFRVAREPPHHFYSVYGTRGSVETDRYDWTAALRVSISDSESAPAGAMRALRVDPVPPGLPPEAVSGGHGVSEYLMLADFLAAVRSGRPPALGVRAALNMTVPGICAHLSADRAGREIEVPRY